MKNTQENISRLKSFKASIRLRVLAGSEYYHVKFSETYYTETWVKEKTSKLKNN